MSTDETVTNKVLQLLESHVVEFSEFSQEARDYHQQGKKTMEKVDAMHASHMQTARYLANLEALPRIAEKIESIKSDVLPSALAQNHVPVTTMNEALKSQAKTYLIIIKSLLWSLGLLITVFVGMKYIVPDFFSK